MQALRCAAVAAVNAGARAAKTFGAIRADVTHMFNNNLSGKSAPIDMLEMHEEATQLYYRQARAKVLEQFEKEPCPMKKASLSRLLQLYDDAEAEYDVKLAREHARTLCDDEKTRECLLNYLQNPRVDQPLEDVEKVYASLLRLDEEEEAGYVVILPKDSEEPCRFGTEDDGWTPVDFDADFLEGNFLEDFPEGDFQEGDFLEGDFPEGDFQEDCPEIK